MYIISRGARVSHSGQAAGEYMHNQMHFETEITLQFTIILLGGLSGRFDQTIHTVSYLHKLAKRRHRTFVVTDDNIGWCLNSVGFLFNVI